MTRQLTREEVSVAIQPSNIAKNPTKIYPSKMTSNIQLL